jgi:hypothetical protein
LSVIILSVVITGREFRYAERSVFYCYAECRYAVCRYAVCRYAVCRYAVCRYAVCRYAECRRTQSSNGLYKTRLHSLFLVFLSFSTSYLSLAIFIFVTF